MYNDLSQTEEQFEVECSEEINQIKKKIETENEVSTLKDLVDNSREQLEEFRASSQKLASQIEIHHKDATNRSRKLDLSVKQMEEEIHEMRAEVQTNQDILKHKRMKHQGTPDKNQERELIHGMKSLVASQRDRWQIQDHILDVGSEAQKEVRKSAYEGISYPETKKVDDLVQKVKESDQEVNKIQADIDKLERDGTVKSQKEGL